MVVYYHIYDVRNPQSDVRTLIAVCPTELQARDTFERLLVEGKKMGLTYLVLERIWTDHSGIVTNVSILQQAQVY